jgi:hypothetical protein
MKKTALLILLTITICCCKKRGRDYSAIVNKWEIRQSAGGVAGVIDYQPGNGYILEFKSDNSFVTYDKGNIVVSGTYDLQSTLMINKYRITFHTQLSDSDRSHDLFLKGDTLVVMAFASCCDIPDLTYVKTN